MKLKRPPPLLAYGFAISLVALTAVAKLVIDRYVGHGPPLVFFLLPVTLTAWYAGLKPGLAATALSGLACVSMFLQPVGSLWISSGNDRLRLVVFLAEGALISGLMGSLHAARDKAEERSARLLQQEEALSQSEERLRLLIEGVTDYAILMLDPGGMVSSWNPGAGRIKGYRAEEVVGRHFSLFYPPEDVAAGKPARELETSELTGRFEEDGWRVRKDGSQFWANVVITPMRDGTGLLRGFSKVTRDITERRRAELEILGLNERLARRNERLAALRRIDLAITSSHDFQLTLATIFDQVVGQLGVHATTILRVDPNTQILEYAGGQGFRGREIGQSRVRMGEGFAGRAALDRRRVDVPDLTAAGALARVGLPKDEGFVAYHAVPLLAKGLVKGVLEVFHREPLAPDAEWLDFLEALAGQAAIALDNAALFDDLQRANLDLTLAYDATIVGWSRALDLRDKETEGHSSRVTEMTVRLAMAMGLGTAELVHVRRGALLHDVGKLGIPDAILLKPGPLTEEEWRVMRRHPQHAYDWLVSVAYLRPALDIPYCHHEKWDGTGYPRGLRGEQIPLAARLFAAVDIWDALRSDRPYRGAWPEARVRDHLRSLAGGHLDPAVVEAFLGLLDGPSAPGRSDAVANGSPAGPATPVGARPAREERPEEAAAARVRVLERENARLAGLAATDELTGLWNRRHFGEALGAAYAGASRYGRPLSLVLLDLDGFKAYNDAHGHPAGDEVLRSVAEVLLALVRPCDVAARHGGEEFAVLIPETDADGAIACAERLRRAIAARSWLLCPVTASFGVATLTPGGADGDLVDQADRALYRAKRLGRDRVAHYEHPSGRFALVV